MEVSPWTNIEKETTIKVTDKIRWYISGLFFKEESRLRARATDIPPRSPHHVIIYEDPLIKLFFEPKIIKVILTPRKRINKIIGTRKIDE